MRIRFQLIEQVKPIHGSNESICLEVAGHMTREHKFDAMAVIWEHIEDDDLIEHFRLQGWELRRLPSEDSGG